MSGTATTGLGALFAGMDIAVPDIGVTDITTRAQRAAEGGLYLACAGLRTHGLEYLHEALERGIVAVAWEPGPGIVPPALPQGVSGFAVPGLRSRLGVIADRYFASPSNELDVIGVTGTNGKSTTAFLVMQALNRTGRRAGYMGTLGYGIGADLAPSALTTPGCVTVHRRLRELANRGASHVIAEVSSHALDQERVAGVRFDIAALTNLSRDHLDYHGSLERYAEAKAKLFHGTGIRTAVINTGDRFGADLAGRLDPGTELLSVALVETGADAPAAPSGARLIGMLTAGARDGIGLQLSGDFGEALLESPLWGRFNGENLLVATGILLACGLDLAAAAEALHAGHAPPGRMQRIAADADAPAVVVDFAHSPAALEQALAVARAHCRGALWCVFGCGGDRDRGKRAAMGLTAATLADHCIVTDDNPRTEDPAAIVSDILRDLPAVTGSADIEVIHDRAAAIGFAVSAARAGDVVLIAGKGHEEYQLIGEQRIEFSDAVVARTALGLTA